MKKIHWDHRLLKQSYRQGVSRFFVESKPRRCPQVLPQPVPQLNLEEFLQAALLPEEEGRQAMEDVCRKSPDSWLCWSHHTAICLPSGPCCKQACQTSPGSSMGSPTGKGITRTANNKWEIIKQTRPKSQKIDKNVECKLQIAELKKIPRVLNQNDEFQP